MAIIYPLLEMVRRGSLGASEIGFIARIAKAAHMGALN
jgi:hypothetical protein